MPAKVNRALLGAVAVSLAAHILLLAAGVDGWFRPVVELSFPIEASLEVPPSPGPAPRVVERRQPVRPVQPPPAAALSEPVPPPAPEAAPDVLPDSAPVVASVPALPLAEPLPAKPVPEAPARPVLRRLPDHFVARYDVQTGEGDGGFVAGRATYVWHVRGGRYSLVSTAEATGLAALFVSGRIVQLSEGSIDEAGLHPEQYWLQRKERKQDIARFQWDQGRLLLEGRGGHALTALAQDLLSFPFHLAMTAREGEADYYLGVTNGRKFEEYGFRNLGRETLEMKGRRHDVLHVQGTREGEGTLDVWLDLERTGLPARIRTLDRKGKVMELRLDGLESAASGD